jgi:DNA-binding response OmpR family regulator
MSPQYILVIDDDPLFRSLLTSILRKHYLVSVAADGADGFAKARERLPAAAVIDIQMPGWDGIQTLKAFRKDEKTATVPIMMLTSDATRPTVLAALSGGADDYLIKTALSREDLLQKVARLVNMKAHRPAPGSGRVLDAAASAAPTETGPPAENGTPSKTVSAPAATMPESAPSTVRPPQEDAIVQSMIDNWE